jgi:site-specific DNA-methyltransferase (adenine-specific)
MIKRNTIYQEDVLIFLNHLENKSIDLAIVDPPYNMNKGYWDKFDDDDDYFNFTFTWLDALIPKMKKDSSLYLFNNPYNSAIICSYLVDKPILFRNWITWHKKDGFSYTKRKFINAQETILFYTFSDDYTFNADEIRVEYESKSRMKHAAKKGILKNGKRWYPNPNGKLCTEVWEFSSYRHKHKVNGKVKQTEHPTPKPEDLIRRMILASSNEGDLILDLFAGTATTSYMAKKNNRDYIGCEYDEDYCKIIEGKGVRVGRL